MIAHALPYLLAWLAAIVVLAAIVGGAAGGPTPRPEVVRPQRQPAPALNLTLHVTLTADEQRAIAWEIDTDLPTRDQVESYVRSCITHGLGELLLDARAAGALDTNALQRRTA